jgi:hypothetical protein
MQLGLSTLSEQTFGAGSVDDTLSPYHGQAGGAGPLKKI